VLAFAANLEAELFRLQTRSGDRPADPHNPGPTTPGAMARGPSGFLVKYECTTVLDCSAPRHARRSHARRRPHRCGSRSWFSGVRIRAIAQSSRAAAPNAAPRPTRP
jgi:hypothetical protein